MTSSPGSARGVVRSIARIALAGFMGLAGVAHFARHDEFLGQVPGFMPARSAVVYVSGVAEIVFAVMLSVTRGRRRRQVGAALAAFLVLVFPGNIYQAVAGTDAFGLDTDAARWGRLAVQPLLVAWAWWSTRTPER